MCSGKSNVAGKKIMTDNILENHIKKKEKTQGELSLADFPASRGAKLEGMQVSSPHVHIILQYHVGTIVASI